MVPRPGLFGKEAPAKGKKTGAGIGWSTIWVDGKFGRRGGRGEGKRQKYQEGEGEKKKDPAGGKGAIRFLKKPGPVLKKARSRT